jgi:flagellar FliJ protein
MRIDSLNSIIKLKEWRKEEISVQVKNIQKLIEQHEQRIKELEDEFEKNLEEFKRNTLNKVVTAEALRMQHDYVEHLTRKVREQKDALMSRIEELKETRLRLTEAQKEEKLIKKLKTKQADRIIKYIRSREQKALDDISIKRYKR